ncbi:Non-ribosomal peptide synthetase [Beggiatoa sp. SS]|nr:Non-ribosomal peptide synthetase [Beggiatoa sp. SS]
MAWNQTKTDYPKDKTVVALFEEQVAKNPSNLAVVFEGEGLSYQELNDKSNQLAHYFLKHPTLENASNPLIAICVERSREMVIGLLGILKAGGAYVPIDPNYPAKRIAYMLKDSGAPLLLTQTALKVKLPLDDSSVIAIDEADFASQATQNPKQQSQPDDLAYLIYTSGSTGKPKGVLVEHRNVLALLSGFEQLAASGHSHSGILTVPISFDVSVWEIFSQLCYGGTLHLLHKDSLLDTPCLVRYLVDNQITSAYLAPALLEPVVMAFGKRSCPLQRLLVGVEPIVQKTLQLFRQLSPQLRIINGYGPTEATVCATLFNFEQAEEPERQTPIGKPVANYQVYVLDTENALLPINIPGEVCIAGAGVARGYLNRPELTAEKFIEVVLFGKRERIYKTGDLARWLPDGNLEYLGRIDHQVKLRGFRIELGEIEAVLCQHPEVKEAVVVLYDADDNKRLVAYVSVDKELTQADLASELKNSLKQQLPDYMIPADLMVLDALPLTSNGKIDRKALPAPDTSLSAARYEPPRSQAEQKIAVAWEQVLKRERLSIHDSFFEVGGHSLLVIQMHSLLCADYPLLKLMDLFSYPTIHALASYLDSNTTSKKAGDHQKHGEKRRARQLARQQKKQRI